MVNSTKISRKFTLIEVIISMMLLVTILGLLFLSSAAVMRSWEQIESHSQTLKDLIALDKAIDSILTNVIPLRWPDEDGEGPFLSFVGGRDKLIFNYIHSFNQLEDGAIRSCCLLQEENQLVAYYCERPPFPEDLNSEGVRRSVLAHNVDSISFSYVDLDETDIEFIDDWEDRDYLPLGIQLQVNWLDGRLNKWLKRTAGSSYYERWGKWEQKDRE